MTLHEREEMDFEMGRGTELQNALAFSRMEHEDDREKINELVSLGRFVLVAERTAYCPRTDALMGVSLHLIGDYESLDEANFHLRQEEGDEETSFSVKSPARPKVVHEEVEEEVPF